MSDLDLLIDGLKRQVAVPGEFDTVFPDTLDTDLLGTLGDAFGQAQLDGFFGTQVFDPTANTITPDLSTSAAALIVLYATERILISRLRDLNTKTLYKAGPVEYETEKGATSLTAQINYLVDRRKEILAQALRIGRSSGTFYMSDAYTLRSFYDTLGWGSLTMGAAFFEYEMPVLGFVF